MEQRAKGTEIGLRHQDFNNVYLNHINLQQYLKNIVEDFLCCVLYDISINNILVINLIWYNCGKY